VERAKLVPANLCVGLTALGRMGLLLTAAWLLGGCVVAGSWQPSYVRKAERRVEQLPDDPRDRSGAFSAFFEQNKPGVLHLRGQIRTRCRYSEQQVYRESEYYRCPECGPSYHWGGWLMGTGTVLGAIGAGLVGAGAHEDRTGDPPDSKKVYRQVGTGIFLLAFAAGLIPAAILTLLNVVKVKRQLKNRVRLLETSHVERREFTRACGVTTLTNTPVDIFVNLRGMSRRGEPYLLRRVTGDANGVVQVDLAKAMAKTWAKEIGGHLLIRWKRTGRKERVLMGATMDGLSESLVVVLKPREVGVGSQQWKVALGGAGRSRIARVSLRCAGNIPLEVKVLASHPSRLLRVYVRGLPVRKDAPALLRKGRALRVKCMPNRVLEVQLLARACCQTSVTITARMASRTKTSPR